MGVFRLWSIGGFISTIGQQPFWNNSWVQITFRWKYKRVHRRLKTRKHCKKTKNSRAQTMLPFLGEGEEITQVTNIPCTKLNKLLCSINSEKGSTLLQSLYYVHPLGFCLGALSRLVSWTITILYVGKDDSITSVRTCENKNYRLEFRVFCFHVVIALWDVSNRETRKSTPTYQWIIGV